MLQDLIEILILSAVQGISEFLPISSSAHLILISSLTTWDDQGIFTDIAVHIGTLGAVIVYLFAYIKKIFIDFFSIKKNYIKENNHFGLKILIATMVVLSLK